MRLEASLKALRCVPPCVLTVDEGVVFLAVLPRVGDDNLDVVASEVDGRIKGLLRHVFLEQVHKTVPRHIGVTVIVDFQPGVEESVVLHHRYDKLVAEEEAFENIVGRREVH